MGREAVRRFVIVGLTALSLGFGMSPGFGQVAIDLETHQDFISALSFPDVSSLSAGSSSPTGTGRPPRVGPNVRANAPQVDAAGQFLTSAGLRGRSETTVASADDGRFIVAGWNDAQGFCGPPFNAMILVGGVLVPCTPQIPSGLSGYAFSSDGGLTWTDGGAPPVINHVFTRGDPWLDRGGFDNQTFYYANLAVDDRPVPQPDPNPPLIVDLGVSVHRGHFGLGGAFVWEDVRVFNAPNAPNDFYDKEAIVAAKDGSGRAYVSLTNFIEVCDEPAFGFGQIEVWRTHDGGDSWHGPTIVSPDVTFITDPADTACGTTGVLQQSSAPAIGPNGEVYVAWQFGPTFTPATSTGAEIRVARSLDGGVTFGSPVTVATINSMRQNPPVGYNRDRINDHPRIAVATKGLNKGRVYVAYYSAVAAVTAAAITPCPSPPSPPPPADPLSCRGQNLTSSQVFLRFSDDGGTTWSSEIPLAPAPPATGVKRWWPVVSVEPGGNVDVTYYESQEMPVATNPFCTINLGGTLRRRGSANSLVNTFWVRSADGGASFSTPMKVSTATTNWCTTASNIRPNFGDYIASVSEGNRVLATWADGRHGVPDTFYSTGLGAGKSGP